MAFNIATVLCLTALYSISGIVHAEPQQFFQQPVQPIQPIQQIQPTQQIQPINEPMTEVCLACLCDAASSCNQNLGCEGPVCGMFRITWAYWADSGKPVLAGDNPNNDLAYARCTTDAVCAKTAVTNYMKRYARDCNGDGVVNCLDYVSIHMLGPGGCSGQLNYEFKNKFDMCQRSVNQLSGSAYPKEQMEDIDVRQNFSST